jgi:hypothetical protein
LEILTKDGQVGMEVTEKNVSDYTTMLHIPCLPPLAALDNILSVVVPLLFLIFWVLGQMGEAKKKAAAKAEARRRHPQPVPRDQDAKLPKKAGPAHADQADPLRQQVEAMLREAGYGVAERPSEPPVAPPTAHGSASRDPTIEVLVDEDPAAVDVVPVDSARRKKGGRLSRPAPGPLVPRTARSIKTQPLTEQASHLGDDIVAAEDKFESGVRAKFASDLGTLKDTHNEDAYEQRSDENPVAGRLASLLTNPEGVREAIILSEILNRPIDRW